jgi:hypothetical protein
VEQVQAIDPRAVRVVEEISPGHDTFKDAKGFWLQLVMVGLLLLGGASVLAIGGIRHEADDAMLMKFKTGFVAGLGGPKLWILSELLRPSATSTWALASLIAYTTGVLAVMWPERVGIMGLAGIGRLIACLMAVAALLFGLDLFRGAPVVARVLRMGYDEIMMWLIFLDMAAMILVNMRVAGIAGRGGYHVLAKVTGGMMALQVAGILMLAFALNVEQKGVGMMWAGAGAYATGGAGVALVAIFLVMRIWWEAMARKFRP